MSIYNIPTKSKWLIFPFTLIVIFELVTNFFTSLLLSIPHLHEKSGLIFNLMRMGIVLFITVIGIICTKQFFEVFLSRKNYPNFISIISWFIMVVFIEYLVFHFGFVRVGAIEGSSININILRLLIASSMLSQLIAGGMLWKISNYTATSKRLKQ